MCYLRASVLFISFSFFTFFSFLFFFFCFVSFLAILFSFFLRFVFFFVSFRCFSPCFLFVFFLSVSFRFFSFFSVSQFTGTLYAKRPIFEWRESVWTVLNYNAWKQFIATIWCWKRRRFIPYFKRLYCSKFIGISNVSSTRIIATVRIFKVYYSLNVYATNKYNKFCKVNRISILIFVI